MSYEQATQPHASGHTVRPSAAASGPEATGLMCTVHSRDVFGVACCRGTMMRKMKGARHQLGVTHLRGRPPIGGSAPCYTDTHTITITLYRGELSPRLARALFSVLRTMRGEN
jgi:hypothetical protein